MAARFFHRLPILSEGSEEVKPCCNSSCLNGKRTIEFLRGEIRLRIRAPLSAEKRACHDDGGGLGAAPLRHSACRSAAFSSGRGFFSAWALPLAARKEERYAGPRPRARPRGFERFELHARHLRESLPPRFSCCTHEPAKLRRNRSAHSDALQLRHER